MNFNNLNFSEISDFEQSICNSLIDFSKHFNNVHLQEKDILEIIALAFYGGKFIHNSKKKIYNYLFSSYIDIIIQYYSEYTDYMNIHFHKNNIKSDLFHQITLNIENEKNNDENIDYKSILHTITMLTKSNFMLCKNQELYNSDITYRNSFVNHYISIDSNKYIQFLIISQYIDDFSTFLSYYRNNNVITKDKVYNTYYECIQNKCETLFIQKLYNYCHEKNNIDFNDFNKYIENILNNVIKTPYYYQSIYKEVFSDLDNIMSNTFESYITNENDIKTFDLIENIKENIIKKGIETADLIEIKYPEICMNEIILHKLNINEFTTKLFFEYFMTSISEAKLCIILDKCANTLNNI